MTHREQLQCQAERSAQELLALAVLETFTPFRVAAVDCITGLVEPTPLFASLDTLVRKLRPGLVIIDPFSGAAALRDENSSAEVNIVAARLADLAKRHNCVVLLVHHTGKSGADSVSQHSLRGSSALAARARWIAQTTPHTSHDTVVLSVVKNSYHRAIDPVLLQRNPSGVPLQIAPNKTVTRDAAEFIAKWLQDHPESGVTEGGLRRRKGRGKDLYMALTELHPVITPREITGAVDDAVDRGLIRRVPGIWSNGRKWEMLIPVTDCTT